MPLISPTPKFAILYILLRVSRGFKAQPISRPTSPPLLWTSLFCRLFSGSGLVFIVALLQCNSQNSVLLSSFSVWCFCPKLWKSNSPFSSANSRSVSKRETGGKSHGRHHLKKKVCRPKYSTLVSLSSLPSIRSPSTGIIHSLTTNSVGRPSSPSASSTSSIIVSHFPSGFSTSTPNTIPSSIASVGLSSVSSFPTPGPSTTISIHSYHVATFGSICSGPSSVPTLPPILSDFELVGTNCEFPNLPTIYSNVLPGPAGPSECAKVCESAGESCAYFALSQGILCRT